VSKWFAANKLAINLVKTNIITFISNSAQYALNIGCNRKCIEMSVNIKFLCLQIDNHLNWKSHIGKLIPKLNEACYAFRAVCHSATLTLKSVHCQ
jgi:hypothetical protein